MPTGFQIGPITIYYYAIILMVGALAGAILAEREARRRGLNSDLVWDAFIWVLIGGIIGARLWHVFTPTQIDVAAGRTTLYYLTHPLDMINTRMGGLGIPGAVIGGGLALYLYALRHHLSFGTWVDIAAPGLALGQAIGRWGNFINQELYGAPTNLPWGIYIDPAHRLPGYENFSRFHPLFLYESIWNFLNMGLLLWLSRRYPEKLKPGDLFLVYLVVYPIGRFFLEFIRLDAPRFGTIDINQVFMLVVAILSGLALILRHRHQDRPVENVQSPEVNNQ